MQKYSWIKESASGRARSEKHVAVRVSAADRFITIETSGAIWAGSSWVGRLLVARFFWCEIMWNVRHQLQGHPAPRVAVHHNQSKVALWLVLFLPKTVRMCGLARKTLCCSSLVGFFVFTHHRRQADFHEVCWLSLITLRAKCRSQPSSSKKALVCANYPPHPNCTTGCCRLSLASIGCIVWVGARDPPVFHGLPSKA